jgi:hypothetical protein
MEAIVGRDTDNPLPLYELAVRSRRQGRMDVWHRLVGKALSLPHHSYQQLHRRGQAKLLLGDWSGWRDLESRIHDPAASYLTSRAVRLLRFNTRAWDGHEPIEDKTLYVIADGGFSDCLQMLRYVPLISTRADRVILCVRPELANLIRRAYGDRVTLTLRGVEDATSYDRYAWMMSLPALMGELPPFSPLPGVIRDEDPVDGVGVCWSGDSEWIGNTERSISQDLLASLFERDGLRWQSLQHGATVRPLPGFAQTAQWIAKLRAVVTVDTAVAHLAGAMGVPTWVLLSADADPRWGLESTTPWYPTVHLIRQRVAGDWTDALTALTAVLESRPWRTATV